MRNLTYRKYIECCHLGHVVTWLGRSNKTRPGANVNRVSVDSSIGCAMFNPAPTQSNRVESSRIASLLALRQCLIQAEIIIIVIIIMHLVYARYENNTGTLRSLQLLSVDINSSFHRCSGAIVESGNCAELALQQSIAERKPKHRRVAG